MSKKKYTCHTLGHESRPGTQCPMPECDNILCHSCKTSAAHAAGLFYDTSDDSKGQYCGDCLDEVSENLPSYPNVKPLIVCPAGCENNNNGVQINQACGGGCGTMVCTECADHRYTRLFVDCCGLCFFVAFCSLL